MDIPYRIMEQQNNFSEDNNFNLPSLLSDDTLSLSEISEKVLYMKKKQEIERKYKEKIKTRKDGRQLNANSFNRWLKRYCEECGVPVRSSHKIRFCTASILYSNGLDLPTLQRLLGHSTAAMSMHYLRRVTPTTDTAAIMTSALS